MDLDPAPDPDLKHCCKVCTVFKFFFIYKFQVSVTCSKGGQRNRRCCFAGAEYRQYIIPSSSGIVQYIQNFGSLQNIMPLTFIYEKITKFPFKQRKYIKLWHKAIKQIWSAQEKCETFTFMTNKMGHISFHLFPLSEHKHPRASGNSFCFFLLGYGFPPFCSCLQLKRRSISC